MGVPGFFAWLIRQYKEPRFIHYELVRKAKYLYIDCNCAIHPKCFEVLKENSKISDIDKLEELMMEKVIEYCDYLENYVDPEELMFVSIDGVAPRPKQNQQRSRRYRSIDDNILRNEIKKKFKLELGTQWSNTVISPGTEFMEKLHTKLLEYYDKKNKSKKNKIIYIYSSYHTPGEGEHKILQHIRKKMQDKKNKINQDDIYVVYGLDADLIFLSIASQKKNIYLLREANQLGSKEHAKEKKEETLLEIAEDLRYVSIDDTKNCYNEKIHERMEKRLLKMKFPPEFDLKKFALKKHDFCNDFIFLCFFIGNDFLPHFPSLDIKKGGLDVILDSYMDIFIRRQEDLVLFNKNNEVSINNRFLTELLKALGKKEYYYFTNIMADYKESHARRRCHDADPFSQAMWDIENMKAFKVDDPIKLGIDSEQEWKFRYYEHYFNANVYQQDTINDVCQSLLEGLLWVTKYYFEECPDWLWSYKYLHAPFISDFADYCIDNKKDINAIKFNINNKPLTPFMQLMCILPSSCKHLLPKQYGNLMIDYSPICDMYPTKIIIDMINKDQYFTCIPLLPPINIDRIHEAVKDIKLSKKEIIRNENSSDFVYE
jgi:5'-3' exonuclease